jgi:hypothetical protein
MVMTFIKVLMAGPEASLKGSPTVSPLRAATLTKPTIGGNTTAGEPGMIIRLFLAIKDLVSVEFPKRTKNDSLLKATLPKQPEKLAQ